MSNHQFNHVRRSLRCIQEHFVILKIFQWEKCKWSKIKPLSLMEFSLEEIWYMNWCLLYNDSKDPFCIYNQCPFIQKIVNSRITRLFLRFDDTFQFFMKFCWTVVVFGCTFLTDFGKNSINWSCLVKIPLYFFLD